MHITSLDEMNKIITHNYRNLPEPHDALEKYIFNKDPKYNPHPEKKKSCLRFSLNWENDKVKFIYDYVFAYIYDKIRNMPLIKNDFDNNEYLRSEFELLMYKLNKL